MAELTWVDKKGGLSRDGGGDKESAMPVTIAVERLEVANPTGGGPYNGSVTVRVDHPLSPNNPQDGHTSFELRLRFEGAPTYREGLQAAVAQLRAIGEGIIAGTAKVWDSPGPDEVRF